MTIADIIRKFRKKIFLKGYFELKRKQRFLKGIIRTNLFSKMKLSDKLTSLASLVKLSKRDFGSTPKALEKKLLQLSNDLKHHELELLRAFHAERNVRK